MTEIDSMIRFYIAIFFMVIAVFTSQIIFLIISIILIFTAIKKRCFIYNLLGINKKIKNDFYYKQQYLENNIDIIIFLDEDNSVLYSNKIEANLYIKSIFEKINNDLYEIRIDESHYKIIYRSILENEIRLIELKKL